MIHAVELPASTLQALRLACQAQLGLLQYAATAGALDQMACAGALNKFRLLAGCGDRIAAWAWSEKRFALLEKFSTSEPGQQAAKVAWLQSLKSDMNNLLGSAPSGKLVACNQNGIPPWQSAAAELLLQFYHGFSSGKGLPFAGSDPNNWYGRQEFLRHFDRQNKSIIVCVMCDESKYSTNVAGNIRTDIDHFFPKSKYPHLCVHPYNLIPVCHLCNSGVKGEKDPLGENQERDLTDIDLPYRSAEGLSQKTYLEVRYQAAAAKFEVGSMTARPDSGDLKQTLSVLADVYGVPGRWSGSADAIANQVFRRLRSYLLESGFLEGRITAVDLLARMDRLVGLTFEKDLGRDPYAFAATWFLATLARELERIEAGEIARSAFLQEVQAWQEKLPEQASDILATGRKLRQQLP